MSLIVKHATNDVYKQIIKNFYAEHRQIEILTWSKTYNSTFPVREIQFHVGKEIYNVCR
jgi:hypothetical protein